MAGPRTKRAPHLLAFAALCAAIVAGAAISSPVGAAKVKTLGKTKHTPPPDCPQNCSAIGKVTGFPLEADGEKHPLTAPENGKLVAWALDLSRPRKKQRQFFGALFGNKKFDDTPTARLSVIRRGGRREYKLLRQSPIVKLSGALGRRETFTLDKPLRVRKGQIVALTTPTWASSFSTHDAHGHTLSSTGNEWRASRRHSNCAPKRDTTRSLNEFARESRPHQKVGSVRKYGCDYKGARLLYWAYYVPS
jgi:hypothetical protein